MAESILKTAKVEEILNFQLILQNQAELIISRN